MSRQRLRKSSLKRCVLTAGRRMPVNVALGDLTFVFEFGRHPDPSDNEELRIRTHLQYVCHMLQHVAAQKLCQPKHDRRSKLLEHLQHYSKYAPLPMNNCLATRTPIFIDKAGNACAVAHLVRVSGHYALAEKLDIHFHTSSIEEIAMASQGSLGDDSKSKVGAHSERTQAAVQLLRWAKTYGFTIAELSLIQPGYTPRDQCLFAMMILGWPICTCLVALSCILVGAWAAAGCPDTELRVMPEHRYALAVTLAMPVTLLLFAAGSYLMSVLRVDATRAWFAFTVFVGLSVCTMTAMFVVVAPWMWAAAGPPIWVQISVVPAFLGPLVLCVWLSILPCMSTRSLMKRPNSRDELEEIEDGRSDLRDGFPETTEADKPAESQTPPSSSQDNNQVAEGEDCKAHPFEVSSVS